MPQARKKTADPDTWTVLFLNAGLLPRKPDGTEQGVTHKARSGVAYRLFAETPTEMPSSDAITFLCDEAYIVKNEEGERVQPMPAKAAANPAQVIDLEPGQSICFIEELTDTALLSRANQRPGGERFNSKTGRKTLIQFLHGISGHQHRALNTEASVEDDHADVATVAMGADEVDKLLEGTA